MTILGKERERVTHFKCLATSVVEMGRNTGVYCSQKDAYETD